MTQYFLHDGNQEQGPFNMEQLKSQNLKGETKIWREGLEHWTTVSKLPELSDLLSRRIPPPINKPTEVIEPEARPSNSNNLNEHLGVKRKSKLFPVLIAGLVATCGIISWLVYQNFQNAKTIDTINNKVFTQEFEKNEAEAESKRKNEEITALNMNYRNNWSEYIRATNSKYFYSELGGISGLEVIVTNKTEYMLDEVQVLVYYVRTNGDNFKTETVTVYNVPAGSSKSISAPDSNRGTSVSMDIKSIISKKMHFCYLTGNWGSNSNDPYFCK
jgi:hypothetical protein